MIGLFERRGGRFKVECGLPEFCLEISSTKVSNDISFTSL
jgi:hypothetical protein